MKSAKAVDKKPRPATKERIDLEVVNFCQKANVWPVRWRNVLGTCTFLSFYAALSIFSWEFLESLALSDEAWEGALRTSLMEYVADRKTLGLDYEIHPDLTAPAKLLSTRFFDVIAGDGENRAYVSGKTWLELVVELFRLCDQCNVKNQFNLILALALLIDSGMTLFLWTHTFVDVKKLLKMDKRIFVAVRHFSIELIPKLVDGHNGAIAFMISTNIGIPDEKKKDEKKGKNNEAKVDAKAGGKAEEKKLKYHAVTVVYSSETKTYLRICNHRFNVFDNVSLQMLCSESVLEAGEAVISARVKFVVARNDDEVKKRRTFRYTKKKDTSKEKETDAEKKEDQKTARTLRPRNSDGKATTRQMKKDGIENCATNVPNEVKEGKNERKKTEKKTEKENNVEYDGYFDNGEEPNITIVRRGPFGEDGYEAIFEAANPGRFLRWVAQRSNNSLVCLGAHRVPCTFTLKVLPKNPSIDQLKKCINYHRKCVRGYGGGPKADFPVQKSK